MIFFLYEGLLKIKQLINIVNIFLYFLLRVYDLLKKIILLFVKFFLSNIENLYNFYIINIFKNDDLELGNDFRE